MKNLKKLFLSLFVTVTAVVSCGDPDLPFEIYDTMKTGGYARLMSQTGEFNYFDQAGSKVTLEVEYYDKNKGQDIASYAISVEYIDSKTKGAKSVAKKAMTTIESSAFVTNADGYLSSTIEIGFAATMTLLGQGAADIDGGNKYRYHMVLTMKDGTTYDAATTDSNLESSSPFSALFQKDISVVCPSDLAGVFSTTGFAKAGDAPWGGDGTQATTGNFEWTATPEGNLYPVKGGDFSYGAYKAVNYSSVPAGTLKNQDACGVLSAVGSSQWGEVYTFHAVTRQADKKVLYLDWSNDYGEAAEVFLTRSDKDWPDLSN